MSLHFHTLISEQVHNRTRDWMPKRSLREELLFPVCIVMKTIHDLQIPVARLSQLVHKLPTLCWNPGWLRGTERNRCPVSESFIILSLIPKFLTPMVFPFVWSHRLLDSNTKSYGPEENTWSFWLKNTDYIWPNSCDFEMIQTGREICNNWTWQILIAEFNS